MLVQSTGLPPCGQQAAILLQPLSFLRLLESCRSSSLLPTSLDANGEILYDYEERILHVFRPSQPPNELLVLLGWVDYWSGRTCASEAPLCYYTVRNIFIAEQTLGILVRVSTCSTANILAAFLSRVTHW